MARQDILFDSTYELRIENGDFVIGDSDFQHVAHILEAEQGQYRQSPLVGVGVRKMLNGQLGGAEKRTIKLQLESDGYQSKKIVKYTGEKLLIRL